MSANLGGDLGGASPHPHPNTHTLLPKTSGAPQTLSPPNPPRSSPRTHVWVTLPPRPAPILLLHSEGTSVPLGAGAEQLLGQQTTRLLPRAKKGMRREPSPTLPVKGRPPKGRAGGSQGWLMGKADSADREVREARTCPRS